MAGSCSRLKWEKYYQAIFKKRGGVLFVKVILTEMSVLARNPHKGPGDEISRETGSGGGKEGLREDREGS